MEVSDSHSVASQLDCPVREDVVCDDSPKAPPCTVTLADPVDPGEFTRRIVLTLPMSVDQASVKLPALPPAVADTRRVLRIPCAAEHRMEVSDSHSVASQLE